MARDRKRAKQRQQRRVREGASTLPSAPIHSDLSDTLGHVSGEVDEFDAAVIRGAGGPSAAAAPGMLSDVAADPTADVEEQQLAPASGGGGRRRGAGDSGDGDGDSGGAGNGRAPLPQPRQQQGNRAVAFLRASWAELQRVQWPDRRQVFQATAVVLGFVAIAGAYLGLADVVAKKIVDVIL
ncbi:MAG TPA: preprotein translocase subunit SecE [Solirubrobacteraceae bacterium]|nr:preprotein translocase subunit SecE [Solirubrobacteraceae bacterium]